jgi:type IV secretion system protein VirB11
MESIVMNQQTMPGARSERGRRLRQKLERELGPEILAALDDPSIVEVMLNSDGRVWFDRLEKGIEKTEITVVSARVESLLGTVAANRGYVINAEVPILECELPGYPARIEGIVPPISRAPIFAIRKHSSVVRSLEDYRAANELGAAHADVLRDAIRHRGNVVVCGGTGSGKTTLANALLLEKLRLGGFAQRIVILEDTLELQCRGENVVSLRTCEAADLARLVRATLRLRPDTIVVGEVRGREALEMLKAWNTGHPGGIATVHANNASAALSRLDQLVQEAGVPAQPHLIAEAIDLLVAIERTSTGRRVAEVVQVEGYERTNGYRLREL